MTNDSRGMPTFGEWPERQYTTIGPVLYLKKVFPRALSILLLGYAFFGRAFAHLGFPPLYVGEIVLCIALLYLASTPSRAQRTLLDPGFALIALFSLWGAIRTVPYLASFGLDALRDGALWGYSAFAFSVFTAISKRRDLTSITSFFGRCLPWFFLWVPVAAYVVANYSELLPTAARMGTPILIFKAGDMSVHLAGAISFLLLGMRANRTQGPSASLRVKEYFLYLLWSLGFLATGAANRGGLLAMLSALLLVAVLAPSRRLLKLMVCLSLVLSSLILISVNLPLSRYRSVTPGQLVDNLNSVVGRSTDQNLSGPREFRLMWWKDIFAYTFWGDYFWLGKGFGINLADDDGYQVGVDPPLRSPHNAHLTVLARMGVPGLALWSIIQVYFATQLWRSVPRFHRAGEGILASACMWILCYWSAFTVDQAFDVSLEGPQGGIWYWCVIGVGLALVRASKSLGSLVHD